LNQLFFSQTPPKAHLMDTTYFSQFEHTYYELTGSGKAPWLREGAIEQGPAYNPYSGVQYQGINGVMLDMSAASRDFYDSRWIALHEAAHLGLTLCHGEKPTPAAYTHSGKAGNSYYLLCNLEQFKEYPRMPERNIEGEREIGKEKLYAALDHSGSARFTEVLEKIDKETPLGGDNLTGVMARYRISQECGEYYIPPANAGALQREADRGDSQTRVIKAVYQAETVKNRLITRDHREAAGFTMDSPVKEIKTPAVER
jgi:hypothetical protein